MNTKNNVLLYLIHGNTSFPNAELSRRLNMAPSSVLGTIKETLKIEIE
jgi:hypothetical protein